MITEFFGDIGYRGTVGSAFAATAALSDIYNTTKPSTAPVIVNTDFSQTPWCPWGTNNQLPKEIAEDIENIGVLDAALDCKGRIGTGKGMQAFFLHEITSDGKEVLEHVNDDEIHEWTELNNSFDFAIDSIYDNLGYGWNCGSYVMDLGQEKITMVKRHDVYEARLGKKDPSTRRIPHLYLSADWPAATNIYDPEKQVRIPLLEEGNELADLRAKIKNDKNIIEFAFAKRTLRNGRHYYPQPIYRSNRAWIKIARSVPAFKIAMFKNSITLQYEVFIHPKYWEDKYGREWAKYTQEEKKKLQEETYTNIDKWLTGEDNAYKSLFMGGFEKEGKTYKYVEVTVVDNKIKDGQFLPDSGAAINEILFALNLNPALMGAGNPGGKAYGDTSGGSNVRETFLVQLMLMESERKANAEVYN
ncbi:MAG TPA: hypothetical protein VF610_04750, partial [Segetibacter sp.]